MVGVAATVLGIAVGVIGVIVAIEPGRVGCFVHLTTCSAANASARPTPKPGRSLIVDAPADPNLPFGVKAPAPHAIGKRYPTVDLSLVSIVNRGRGVADVSSRL